MFHGDRIFAAFGLALVLAGFAGLGLAVIRDSMAARRADRRQSR